MLPAIAYPSAYPFRDPQICYQFRRYEVSTTILTAAAKPSAAARSAPGGGASCYGLRLLTSWRRYFPKQLYELRHERSGKGDREMMIVPEDSLIILQEDKGWRKQQAA